MSLKAVELQIAIPKTFDAGKIADQQQQHVVNQQMHANEAHKRDVAKQQTIVNDTDSLNALSDNDEQEAQQNEQQAAKEKNKKQIQKAQHPFKGNLFDFSG